MGDLEIPFEPVSNRDHRIVKRAILAVVVPEAFDHQDGNAESACMTAHGATDTLKLAYATPPEPRNDRPAHSATPRLQVALPDHETTQEEEFNMSDPSLEQVRK